MTDNFFNNRRTALRNITILVPTRSYMAKDPFPVMYWSVLATGGVTTRNVGCARSSIFKRLFPFLFFRPLNLSRSEWFLACCDRKVPKYHCEWLHDPATNRTKVTHFSNWGVFQHNIAHLVSQFQTGSSISIETKLEQNDVSVPKCDNLKFQPSPIEWTHFK